MDVPLQHVKDVMKATVPESFNPCFNGCSSSTFIRSFAKLQNLKVSILVLMDVPLQLFFINLINPVKKSFNPCFNGCSSSTEVKEFYKLTKY